MTPETPSPTFERLFVDDVPGDPVADNYRRQVLAACYSRVTPTPVASPRVLATAREVVELLGLPQDVVDAPWFAATMGGNSVLPTMAPYAMCYGGHQFGNWAGQLGDGRAISLGELVNDEGERYELQLKGAGPTPYSRSGDGRAVLRSSIREFLCSEAMHHLGVPTTRALSLVQTGDAVVRDILYSGHPRPEPGAIVCRVAPSFIRFGNFQILAARGDTDTLRTLTDHTLRRHFAGLIPPDGTPTRETYVALLSEVTQRTARMVVEWMRVGFVHGVMNTDNMSVLGITIDYGPYGWLDDFAPDWTPNTTDAGNRRYRYRNQPGIALWNLERFAEALLPLIEEVSLVEAALRTFVGTFQDAYRRMWCNKLGLSDARETDDALFDGLHEILAAVETDMTIVFRALAEVPAEVPADDRRAIAPLAEAFYEQASVTDAHATRLATWLRRYAARRADDANTDTERHALMTRTNPKYVLRNYLAQEAIDLAEAGDASRIHELLDTLRRPYDEQPERARFAAKRPEWARNKPGCSMLSCSS